MGRESYRRGRAPIRTAAQLAELLPSTIYLLASGFAGPLFPNNGRAAPSLAVKVICRSEPPLFLEHLKAELPLWVHWTQWENVVVPIMADSRTLQWANQFSPQTVTAGVAATSASGVWGQPLPLPNNVVGPDGTVVYSEGSDAGMSLVSQQHPSNLYGNGMQSEYLRMMAKIVLSVAKNAGY